MVQKINKEATRYFSDLQEKWVAKALDGKVTPNSGASHFATGDVIIPNTMVIECKTTTKETKSITIKREWLEQVEHERLNLMLPHSALAISLDHSGENNMYLINEKLMKILLEAIR